MKNLSLNADVKVQLTEYGYKIMEELAKQFGGKLADIDDEGFIKIQLWELMKIFGQYTYAGNPNQVFVSTSIQINEEELGDLNDHKF